MDALQLLGSLLGNNATSSSVGGQILNQLATGLGGGKTSSGGNDLVSLLGNIAIAALQGFAQRNPAQGTSPSPLAALGGGLGSSSPLGALAGSLGLVGSPSIDTTQLNQQALTLIKAMINAAKADGQIDAEEQQRILAKLADAGPQEIEFLRTEIAKPLTMDFLANLNPAMATEVYAVSLMAINVDTAAEFDYLQQLAQHLGLDSETINGIHGQLGLSPLYAV
jgi:uncharacterized membrane protein YebE (DUF533 family)